MCHNDFAEEIRAGRIQVFCVPRNRRIPATLDALRQLQSAALRDTYMNRLPVSSSGAWRDANHPDIKGNPTEEEKAAWEARFRAGPTGMIVYHAAGDAPVSLKKLSVQFLSDVLAAGIVSYLLSLVIVPYWRRVGLATLLGLFGLFAISSIYWNWYGFPNVFFLAQGVDMVVGWSLAGAVIAKLIPPARI
jgi:hypothetical protein